MTPERKSGFALWALAWGATGAALAVARLAGLLHDAAAASAAHLAGALALLWLLYGVVLACREHGPRLKLIVFILVAAAYAAAPLLGWGGLRGLGLKLALILPLALALEKRLPLKEPDRTEPVDTPIKALKRIMTRNRFIIRRLAWTVPILWVIATLTFFFMRVAPGGPFDEERNPPPEVRAAVEAKYNLDAPLYMQYWLWLNDTVRGDLGPSFFYQGRTVAEVLRQGLPATLALGLTSLGLALVFGITSGLVSAYRQNTWLDYSFMSVAVLGISVPTFVIGPLLMLVFAIKLGWLPVSGWGELRHLVLPALALAAPYSAYIARLTRAGVLDVIRQDFITTARAKGLPESRVVLVHTLKGGILPVVSYLGPAVSGVLTGSLVIERIFNVPGIGSYFVNSALNRDYNMVLGTTLIYSSFLIVMNLIVDVAYTYLDPRVRFS